MSAARPVAATAGVLLTAGEVAERLRLSRRTVEQLVKAERLPAVAVTDSTLRFRAEDIDRYLAERYRPAS